MNVYYLCYYKIKLNCRNVSQVPYHGILTGSHHAMPCHNNKNCGKVTNQEANSFGVHQEDGYEDETRIDLRKNIRIRGMMKFLKHVMFTKKTWDKQALTSFRSIIDHNPKTIIKPFLLCNKFGGIKQIAKNLSVPLFCL